MHARLRNASRCRTPSSLSFKLLHIRNARVTDRSFHVLEVLRSLENLELDGTLITDEALEYVGDLSKLTTLDLEHSKVTSKGLKQLIELRDLRSLAVAGTGADTTHLEESLPNCLVYPSTKLRDEEVRRGLSVDRLISLVDRMIALSRAPFAEGIFHAQQYPLERFAARLGRASRSAGFSVPEWYNQLIVAVEPADLSMQLRLSAAILDEADRACQSIASLDREEQMHSLSAANAQEYTRQLGLREMFFLEAAQYLCLPAELGDEGRSQIIAGICARTRPAPRRNIAHE